MFAACFPLYGAVLAPDEFCTTDVVAILVSSCGLFIEGIADMQMDAFQTDRKSKRTEAIVIDRGLWLWTRHPNYFGETTWWWGVWLFAAHAAPRWVLVGPCGITVLFLLVSVKLMEDRQLENKGDAYREYMRRVPSDFVPVPPSVSRSFPGWLTVARH